MISFMSPNTYTQVRSMTTLRVMVKSDFPDYRFICGPFLVIEKLDRMEHPVTDERLAKVKKELEKLRKLGIRYDGFKRENFLYDVKNDVGYIIEFQSATIMDST
ncbi:unnamed protein product [Ambrosiozyma monospora]|uniref:Unnamed protein product n=1 Tax=Ambrosiozyma monospora TaxID=43982 RepID=A0ACB5UDL9_AMBMO|nr:unnamed protein product [Ambrosiozyma monospora]